jgi:hypothetical protein
VAVDGKGRQLAIGKGASSGIGYELAKLRAEKMSRNRKIGVNNSRDELGWYEERKTALHATQISAARPSPQTRCERTRSADGEFSWRDKV